MASKPGILTEWPWKSLGNFKYVLLAPALANGIYSFTHSNDGVTRELFKIAIIPILLWRMLHDQIWISLSRYQTAKGAHRIVHKGIEFEQVDRERSWDDQILFNGILFYLFDLTFSSSFELPLWSGKGLVIMALLHAGPVEFLYYWLHRALHHHFLYSRYHSHHHSSIVTEPITSVVHPFAEHIIYYILFSIPIFTTALMGTGSVLGIIAYLTYVDFMNNMGHCNFELIPKTIFSIFPALKYFMYTPSFHSLHHTQFRTNYSLFMPIYDYIYGTMDVSTDKVYENSLMKLEDVPNVVHLTHLTTPESIFHMRLGFASLASRPINESKWLRWAIWPITYLFSIIFTWIHGHSFVVERNRLENLNLQTWALPKFNMQYCLKWQRESINNSIEEAILLGEERGVQVISLGLLNQSDELNMNGELYIEKYPKLKIKVVDGSSLAVAVVLQSIPQGTTQVFLKGNLSKVAYAIVSALCNKGIKVGVSHESEHSNLSTRLNSCQNNLVLTGGGADSSVWLVGDGLSDEEQMNAEKGTILIPYSQFPPKKLRSDCLYHTTPAMMAPKSLQNLDACENWLGRGVMSAWRVAGIVHALCGWKVNECGESVFDIDKIWRACLSHGFRPLTTSAQPCLG